jgi:hypothetical protein
MIHPALAGSMLQKLVKTVLVDVFTVKVSCGPINSKPDEDDMGSDTHRTCSV